MSDLCKCGCGQEITYQKYKNIIYIQGHNRRGKNHSAESKRKISQNSSHHISWNKGKTKKEFPQMSRAGVNKNSIPWIKGKHHSEESKLLISISAKGRPNKNKGKSVCFNTGRTHFKKGIKFSEDYIKKCLKRNPKSSLEINFEKIINNLNLPYKFVGNGEFFIGRKCPDFINVNGQKIAIEVYYRKHKLQFRNKTIEQWQHERQEIFNQYGWKIEFFDEKQVNEIEIKRRIG